MSGESVCEVVCCVVSVLCGEWLCGECVWRVCVASVFGECVW